MPKVFNFINDGLKKYSDNNGIYDKKLRNHCLALNKLLNDVTIPNYNNHFKKNINAIREEIEIVNTLIHEELFIDLSKIVSLLENFQYNNQILQRDHYYHSIQCFLLAITLIKKFYPSSKLHKNTIAILYSLTMYHDIGYLYKAENISKDRIDESFANFFLCRDLIHKNDFNRTLCLNTEQYQSDNPIDVTDRIENITSISNIWELGSLRGEDLIKNDPELQRYPAKDKNSHAYNSTLILYKILDTKNKINDGYEWLFKKKIIDNNIDWFKQILQAIFIHDRESLFPPLNIKTDFYSVYLMIIDELQTYGRQLSSDTRHALINPKDVGFSWNTANPKKLEIKIVTTNAKLIKKYAAHNPNKIISILSKKIDKKSLANLM